MADKPAERKLTYDAIQAANAPRVFKEGHLKLRRGTLWASWKDFHFRLYETCLVFRKHPTDAKPSGVISITHCAVWDAKDDTGKELAFKLYHPRRPEFFFLADTKAEKQSWMEAIVSCVKLSNSRDDLSSLFTSSDEEDGPCFLGFKKPAVPLPPRANVAAPSDPDPSRASISSDSAVEGNEAAPLLITQRPLYSASTPSASPSRRSSKSALIQQWNVSTISPPILSPLLSSSSVFDADHLRSAVTSVLQSSASASSSYFPSSLSPSSSSSSLQKEETFTLSISQLAAVIRTLELSSAIAMPPASVSAPASLSSPSSSPPHSISALQAFSNVSSSPSAARLNEKGRLSLVNILDVPRKRENTAQPQTVLAEGAVVLDEAELDSEAHSVARDRLVGLFLEKILHVEGEEQVSKYQKKLQPLVDDYLRDCLENALLRDGGLEDESNGNE